MAVKTRKARATGGKTKKTSSEKQRKGGRVAKNQDLVSKAAASAKAARKSKHAPDVLEGFADALKTIRTQRKISKSLPKAVKTRGERLSSLNSASAAAVADPMASLMALASN